MIITCPNCATRYQADAAKFPAAGRKVKCAKCGHAWHQDPPALEPAAVIEEPVIEEPAPPPPPAPPQPEPAFEQPETEEPAPRASAFAPEPVAVSMHTPVIAEAAPRRSSQLSGRIGVMIGWLLLALIVIVIVWAGISYRKDIATAWPQTASLYGMLGMPVNARGIDFTDISYRREKQDGQFVLAITGNLVNSSGREQPVPQIRAALSDDEGRELYHWTFSSGITTMHPDQVAKFVTRISSPPPHAKNLEVRFAREGE